MAHELKHWSEKIVREKKKKTSKKSIKHNMKSLVSHSAQNDLVDNSLGFFASQYAKVKMCTHLRDKDSNTAAQETDNSQFWCLCKCLPLDKPFHMEKLKKTIACIHHFCMTIATLQVISVKQSCHIDSHKILCGTSFFSHYKRRSLHWILFG